MTSHFIHRCADHGTVLAQCRCAEPSKPETRFPCPGPPACAPGQDAFRIAQRAELLLELHDRVENDFTNHPPVGEGVGVRMDDVTAQCLAFAHWIIDHVPPGREQSLALTQLEQTSMWCKAGLARNQPPADLPTT